MKVYYLLGQKMYRRNLQYRLSHVINTLGSAIFGYITIFIWVAAAGSRGGLGNYSVQQLVLWMAFGQVMFNIANAASGLNIHLAVRSGDVSLELLRPIDYFFYVIAREAGQHIYYIVYRAVPLYLLYALTVGYHIPTFSSMVLLVMAIVLAIYTSLCLFYVVGISSFWTVDIKWSTSLNIALIVATSGMQIPVDLLPGVLGRVVPYLPWSAIAHYPNLIYLEMAGVEGLLMPLGWAAILTLVCRKMTSRARRKLEVQGG